MFEEDFNNEENDLNEQHDSNATDDKKEEPEAKGDDSSSISADLIRGHINTIILRALYERDKYGYEIITDIEAKSHGQYTLKQPTLYSALKRLETQGYIKAYWKTDEVSSGGRRKYFKLTDSGKEITEKNLAEWEYSRTIIDNLISDRSFDFSQPAPTPVDFTILRDSVSRVPIVKSDEANREVAESDTTEIKQAETSSEQTEENVTETIVEKQETVIKEQTEITEAKTETKSEAPKLTEEEKAAIEEQRRIVHENYLRLISAPVREPEPVVDNVVPNSENINTDSLIYTSKPETERDYKNLIDSIYFRAINNGSVQTNYSEAKRQRRTDEQISTRTVKLIDKGREDGIVVKSSSTETQSNYAIKTTYDKGITLLKCSAIILAFIIIEFVLCLIFKSKLEVGWIYPVAILVVGIVQFVIIGVLALQGYGKNSIRPTTHNYLSVCLVLTVIIILIICSLSFLLKMRTVMSDILKMIVIPSITALNISFFGLFYRIFLR